MKRKPTNIRYSIARLMHFENFSLLFVKFAIFRISRRTPNRTNTKFTLYNASQHIVIGAHTSFTVMCSPTRTHIHSKRDTERETKALHSVYIFRLNGLLLERLHFAVLLASIAPPLNGNTNQQHYRVVVFFPNNTMKEKKITVCSFI